ncbi:MAG: putative damage-inducible protein DinB [Planctomycetota bacterium]|jgi:uncharacterized damage-inducible protein DinB
MKTSRLNDAEFANYFNTYTNLVEDVNVVKALKKSKKHVFNLLKNLPKEKHEFRYAEGKWTVKEMLLHIIDNERVFINRALRFSRNDATALPGYEHNEYVGNSNANSRKLKDILKEYKTQRNCSIQFFKGLDDDMLKKTGIAGGNKLSVRAIAYILAGHDIHHCSVFEERYL